jgi:hypothetical protein
VAGDREVGGLAQTLVVERNAPECTGGGRRHPLAPLDSGGRAGMSAVFHAAAEEGPLVMATGASWRMCGGDRGGAVHSGV